MKTSIATVSVPGNLREKLEAIAAAGFDGVEIFEQDFIADAGSPRDVGRMICDHGLEITLFQPFRDFEGLSGKLRTKAFDRAERKFDLMLELGTDLVLFCSSVHPQSLGGVDRAAEDFHELGARAAARGIRVGYEALGWGKHINDHRDAWEIVRRADHENVGLILDSFHTLGRKLNPETIRSIPGDKIFFVQLADAPAIEMDLLYWSRHFRNMPGEGDLDVTAFTRAVLAAGYAGPLSLEIFNDQFRSSSARGVAKDGYRALASLMDDVKRQEPECLPDHVALPERIEPQGVAFVEFTSRDAEAEALRRLLETLGFSQTGRHVSKALSLWQQGKIRILINEEQTGLAASMFNARGTSIYDIGLTVPTASATVERAKGLGAEPFSQPLSHGQTDIPAIRGLSGSVLHFLDGSQTLSDVWSVEFEVQTADRNGVGLTTIDHIAQTMSYDEMLSWSLFYTTLFDMEKDPMVDVTDPDGLVRSQALTSGADALRITLNGAETHRTFAGSFLADSFGAPVQHIAFACDDIFATARALEEQGFAQLPLPENYFADVASRFDLPANQLAEMKRLNILYDEDESGVFFQLYSKPFAGGMFFELVERRSGYHGFGGPNAPFRIAAQKRFSRGKGIPKS